MANIELFSLYRFRWRYYSQLFSHLNVSVSPCIPITARKLFNSHYLPFHSSTFHVLSHSYLNDFTYFISLWSVCLIFSPSLSITIVFVLSIFISRFIFYSGALHMSISLSHSYGRLPNKLHMDFQIFLLALHLFFLLLLFRRLTC